MRRTAQVVFQNADSSLNPSKTVAELIGRPLRRFAVVAPGEVASRVRALLDMVRLPAHYAERHQLSGGEKQRVGIARALATEPRSAPVLERQNHARTRLLPNRPGGDHARGCPFARRCPRRLGDICERDAPPVRRLTATHSFACHHDALSK
jgi:ABC-type dipeptide/oligopeptide/nickel transport system ATPase component